MMNVKWNAMDVGYCESVQGGGPTRHFAVESIWTAKSCERDERQLELQGVHIGVTRQPGVENGLL